MKTNNFFRNSAIGSAVFASLCCITPVLAVLGGLSGIASTFSFLEPLRPYFIGFTVIILGYAFYNAYKPKKRNGIDCACETNENKDKKSFINSKAFLWLVVVIAIALITFPYYSQAFFPETQNTATNYSNHITEAKLEIEGMTCTSCEHSVDYALKSENGVLSAESSYETGIAYIQYDESKVKPEQLKQAVEGKVGYKVKGIKIINEEK